MTKTTHNLACPACGSTVGHCAECGKHFEHGTRSQCDAPDCIAVNAPIDCACGFVLSSELSGVLDFDMHLLPFVKVAA